MVLVLIGNLEHYEADVDFGEVHMCSIHTHTFILQISLLPNTTIFLYTHIFLMFFTSTNLSSSFRTRV